MAYPGLRPVIKRVLTMEMGKANGMEPGVYDLLVEQWNDLNDEERKERRDQCRQVGHRWSDVTQHGVRVYTLCQNCLTYREEAAFDGTV
jgi:hypothetical protein